MAGGGGAFIEEPTMTTLSEQMNDAAARGCTDADIAFFAIKVAALEAEVARLREALHPGRLAPMVVELGYVFRGGQTGLWRHKPDADGFNDDLKVWCLDANRYESLTGLDAQTGEKR